MKYNRICQILGIEKPVIQGPLSWLTDARLVAAVSNAGGLGVLGPNAGLTAETAVSTPEETAEKMREEIRKTKKLTEKPFGVNLIPTPENDIWTPPILQVIKMGGLRGLRIGMLEGNTDEGYIALGTGIGNIRSIKSVAEVVNELAIC
ncbi:nitronate monooxygenase [Salmonella enterica]|nr:nitronate monooxygenase [Salmonella enterica]